MEKNHICKKCGGIAGWDSYFQAWICTRCGNEEPKPNFNLSPLELAKRDNDESQSHLCNSLNAMHGLFMRLGSTNDDTYIPVKATDQKYYPGGMDQYNYTLCCFRKEINT